MKKMFEITIKSKHEINYNSDEFKKIKENVKETIINKLGEDEFKKIGYQCNCSKFYNHKKDEYILFIKIYGWHKEKNQEFNFYINNENSISKKVVPTLKEKQKLLKKLKKEISQLRYKLAVTYLDITDTIAENPNTEETFDTVDELNEKIEILRNEIDEKVTQHDFINLEIMIGDVR